MIPEGRGRAPGCQASGLSLTWRPPGAWQHSRKCSAVTREAWHELSTGCFCPSAAGGPQGGRGGCPGPGAAAGPTMRCLCPRGTRPTGGPVPAHSQLFSSRKVTAPRATGQGATQKGCRVQSCPGSWPQARCSLPGRCPAGPGRLRGPALGQVPGARACVTAGPLSCGTSCPGSGEG